MKRLYAVLLLVALGTARTSLAESEPTPVAEAVPAPSPAPAAPAVAGPEVRIRWEAKSEDQVYGYLVYRANRREGPYRRVSREIVRKGPSPGPHAYQWVDTEVEPGRTYFYYLETVSLAGKKGRFSPVLSKTVTPPPAPSVSPTPAPPTDKNPKLPVE